MNSIALTVALPLLAAFLTPSVSRLSRTLGLALGPLALLGSLILILQLASAGSGTGTGFSVAPTSLALGGFSPPFGINFYVDELALLFAGLVQLVTLVLWPWKDESVKDDAASSATEDATQNRARQLALTLLLAAAATGLSLSGDLFNIYVFYELLSVATFGLVASGSRQSSSGATFTAAFRYLAVSGLGSVLALTGITLIYSSTGTLNLAQLSLLAPEFLADNKGLAAFALILLGVGVKAELFPVNTWVPEVYSTASRRITALLAGLISKIAVLVILRILVLIFPSDEARQLMLILGMVGVLAGELSAWRAKDYPRMLAFSSIGQLSMVFIAFSLPGEAGLLAGLAIALHHLLVKPGLFLLAESWGGALDKLSGVAHQTGQFWPAMLFVLLALSLLGMPPLPGFWAKLLLVKALVMEQDLLTTLALIALLSATVVEANYLLTLAVRLFHKDAPAEAPPAHHALNRWTVGLIGLLLVIGMVDMADLGDGLTGIAAQAADVGLYQTTVYPQGGGS